MEACAKLDTLQSVELAEGVVIRLRIAGPLPRALAYLTDFLIRLALFITGILLALMTGAAMGSNVAQGLILLSWFLLDWLYPVLFEAGRRGATPGKRMLGLRVVQASGSPLTVGQAVVRNFLRFIDGMPPIPLFTYALGMASCLATRRFQRLGDLAAGTVVVYARTPPQPMIPGLPPTEPMAPPVALTADEKHALAMFSERAGLWTPGRRIEIANHAAPLTDATGEPAVKRLLAMAAALRGRQQADS